SHKGGQVLEFLSESRFELRKVVWPTRQEATRTTWGVILAVIILSLLLAGFDVVIQAAAKWLLGRSGDDRRGKRRQRPARRRQPPLVRGARLFRLREVGGTGAARPHRARRDAGPLRRRARADRGSGGDALRPEAPFRAKVLPGLRAGP